jgi:hypothetical protein
MVKLLDRCPTALENAVPTQSQSIGQVAISGGEIAPVSLAVSDPGLVNVSPDGSTFLVTSITGGRMKAYPLWSVRILGGSARRLPEAVDTAWSPNCHPALKSDLFWLATFFIAFHPHHCSPSAR